MKGKNFSKLMAGVMGAAMAFTASVPAVHAVAPADAQLTNKVTAAKEGTVVYECDFESDTDLQYWANRGGDDTTELSITPDAADSGKSSMLASGRSETWNGPSLRLDKFLKPDTQYYLSASVKGQWYTNCTLSSQFTIDGEDSWSRTSRALQAAATAGEE